MGWRRRSSKIRGGSKEVGTRVIPQIDKSLWKESKWEDANKKSIGSYNRFEEEVCAQKRENISFVQRRKRRSEEVYLGVDEKGIHLTVQVITDSTSVLCGKEE